MVFEFEKLDVWHKSMELVEIVYQATRTFPAQEQFCLTSQVRRASVSIPVNISEGKGRHSKKEYSQFLYNARGSLYETVTLLKLALTLQYLSQEEYQQIVQLVETVMRKLSGLIHYLKKV